MDLRIGILGQLSGLDRYVIEIEIAAYRFVAFGTTLNWRNLFEPIVFQQD
ncbi:hypothetical protein [Novipirellula herctigrandis]